MPEKQNNDLLDDQTNEEIAMSIVRSFKDTKKLLASIAVGDPLPENNFSAWLENLKAEAEHMRKEEEMKNAD